MSRLEANFNDLPEAVILDEDTEVEFSVKSAEIVPKKSKPGEQQLHVVLELVGQPLTDEIHHYFGIPNDDGTRDYVRAMTRIKTFCTTIKYDLSNGLDTDDMAGCTGWGILRVEDDAQYGRKNSFKKFV
jgi:hypothetical protein